MSPTAHAEKHVAYGGVVIRNDGTVLLREPRGHFDGYVWTFPKGRPNPGETPEATAIRETEEETGARVSVVGPIPGDFPGSTTINRYFLMAEAGPGAPLGVHDDETNAVRWATREEAEQLIRQTVNSAGLKRDLAVLQAAFSEHSRRT